MVGDGEKGALLGDAAALLLAIQWPKPFGLVEIEAMAKGTSVIAFRRGAAPEIAEDGVTGFVVNGIEAVAALPAAARLDRTTIRGRFDGQFRGERMARDCLAFDGEALRRGAVERGPRDAVATGGR